MTIEETRVLLSSLGMKMTIKKRSDGREYISAHYHQGNAVRWVHVASVRRLGSLSAERVREIVEGKTRRGFMDVPVSVLWAIIRRLIVRHTGIDYEHVVWGVVWDVWTELYEETVIEYAPPSWVADKKGSTTQA